MIPRILAAVPRPARLFLAVATADVLLFSLLRGAFAAVFAASVADLPAGVAARAFLLGARFDARLAVLVALPLLLLGGLWRLSPRNARPGWVWYLTLTPLLLLFVHAIDLGHYAFAASRVNAWPSACPRAAPIRSPTARCSGTWRRICAGGRCRSSTTSRRSAPPRTSSTGTTTSRRRSPRCASRACP